MKHVQRRFVAGAIGGTLAITALGATQAPLKYSDTTLPNGLRVIIAEDHTAPVFSVVVNYDVGSRNERDGRTGFAHLFEHMMFKGSENVGQGEHPYLMFMNGGNMNGTTNKDRTMYYETLAVEPARSRAVPRGRSHAVASDHERKSRQSDQCRAGGAPAGCRQRALRPRGRHAGQVGVRQLRVRPFHHRLDGRPERGHRRGRRAVLQDVLCAEQRDAGDRRRRRRQGRVGQSEAVLRRDPAAAEAAAPSTCRKRRRPRSIA